MNFEIKEQFLLDGKPVKLISGAIHYFRILPERWHDSLLRLKACGLNCVETYMPWNLHEKDKDRFDFSGGLDIGKFLETAKAIGLMAIVRPGPYICAEWEFGGLPWWLINEPDIQIRCMNEPYLRHADSYLQQALAQIKPHLVTNGGNVLMVQVENEYGSYGGDMEYLAHIRDLYIKKGIDTPLFTSDGPTDSMLESGTCEDCFITVNFGSNPEERYPVLEKFQTGKPIMCMEYWDGWFDHWGADHTTRSAADVADNFKRMLNYGSVNFYMFQGGTNFGFMNGANYYENYKPTVSSYDYSAPVTECGDITDTYLAVREICKEVETTLPDIPANHKKTAYGSVFMNETADIFDAVDMLAEPIKSKTPLNMEKYGQGYGYILYRNTVATPGRAKLSIVGLADRAQVYVDSKLVKIIYRNDAEHSVEVEIPHKGSVIDILVENMGRVNYGVHMFEGKGINKAVCLDTRLLFDWEVYRLPLDNLDRLAFKKSEGNTDTAAFYRGTFTVDEAADTFLRTDNFKKGVAFVNGFNLGRYWETGPTKTLYIPAPLLRQGENELIIFESDGLKGEAVCTLTDKYDLG